MTDETVVEDLTHEELEALANESNEEEEKEVKKEVRPMSEYTGSIMDHEAAEEEIEELEAQRETALKNREKAAAVLAGEEIPEEEKEPTPEEEEDKKLSAEEQTYKQRYGDLRTHVNKIQTQHKAEVNELTERITKLEQSKVVMPELASEEDIEALKVKAPAMYKVLQTLIHKGVQESNKNLGTEMEQIKKRQKALDLKEARMEVERLHPDFKEINTSEEFKHWIKVQPGWVREKLFSTEDFDAAGAAKVIDLFKSETKWNSSKADTPPKKETPKRDQDEDAAAAIGSRKPAPANRDNRKFFKESDVKRMSTAEYGENEAEIDKAIAEGRFVYDISGQR